MSAIWEWYLANRFVVDISFMIFLGMVMIMELRLRWYGQAAVSFALICLFGIMLPASPI